jgi:hypothetical protein
MSANWWASKLGASPPATRTESTPPTYRPPGGIRIAAQPPAPPPAYTQQHSIAAEEPQVDPNGQVRFMDAMKRWKGTRAAQAIDSCPACGSPHVFAIQRGINGAAPAPRCTACGWNGGLFDQGDQANWV